MGNCLKPIADSREPYKAEETKPLVTSIMHDHVILNNHDCYKKRKTTRFRIQADDAIATMRSPRIKRGVRVKLVLTQSELNQILERATTCNHHPPPSMADQVSRQTMVKYRKRRSPMMCGCSWNPTLQTIHEYVHKV